MQWKTENRCTVWGKAYSPWQPWQGMMVNRVEYSLFSFSVFYFPCLSLPSIWLHLASVLANALGWTGPCQTWIHQSLSASHGGERVGGKAGMEGWGQGRREGRLGWSVATSPPSLTLFFSPPCLKLLQSLESAVRSGERLSSDSNQEVHGPKHMFWGEEDKEKGGEREQKKATKEKLKGVRSGGWNRFKWR